MKRHQLITIAAVVLVACVDGGRSSGPNFAISDATHGDAAGRNDFFFWLPPLVPAPSPTGDFNRFASPIVTVCELVPSGAACAQSGGHPILVAQFSMTSGTGGEIIQISGQQYHVNWQTDISNLNPDKVYRIGVAVEGRDYGFADVEVGLNAKELKNVNRNEFVPLVDGRTLPIQFRIEAGASCAGREASCAEAIVDPKVQETVILENDDNVRLAFGDFPVGWTNGPQVVRIERIPDGDFGPGEGPLGTDFPQYPLFFHYFTSAPEPFNLPVRIGLCNVQDDPEGDDYHPQHRPSTVLAMGGEGDFRTLPRAPVADVLGTTCFGAEREGSDIGALPHGLGDVAARVGLFAASLLAPRRLEASMLVVDGGMGGSTEFFTPAGTVDTATAGLGAPALLSPLSEPLIIQNNADIGCTLSTEATRGYGYRIDFDWADVEGATGYEIFAEHAGSALPIVSAFVEGSSYTLTSCNSFVADDGLTGWHWRVRAFGSGETAGLWSEFADFVFEPCRLPDESVCRVP